MFIYLFIWNNFSKLFQFHVKNKTKMCLNCPNANFHLNIYVQFSNSIWFHFKLLLLYNSESDLNPNCRWYHTRYVIYCLSTHVKYWYVNWQQSKNFHLSVFQMYERVSVYKYRSEKLWYFLLFNTLLERTVLYNFRIRRIDVSLLVCCISRVPDHLKNFSKS